MVGWHRVEFSSARCLRATGLALAVVLGHAAATAADNGVPPLSEVQRVATAHFATLADRQAGDLLTAGDVAPLLAALARQGFDVSELEEGVEFYLPDHHPLARRLRTAEGVALMRKIGHLPGVYDRLDRLSSFAQGRELLEQVFASPDPVAMAGWLCQPETAVEIEERWPDEPGCENFGVRTGRLYTRAQVLAHLQAMHGLAYLGLRRPHE